MSDDGTPDRSSDDPVAGAVDAALADEVKLQKARFVQALLGLDRADGAGRSDERWDEGFDRRHRE